MRLGQKRLQGTGTSFFVPSSSMKKKVLQLHLVWPQDTQHDTWLKEIQHNGTWLKDIQHNGAWLKDIQHNHT
jgi:hypothetical protein